MPTDQLACLPRKDCRLWQEWHGFSHTVHGFDWVCHKRYRRYRCLIAQRIDGLSSFSGFYTCIYDGAQTVTPFSDTATSTMETELPLPLIPANGFSWNRTCKPIFAASRFMTSARHKEQEQPAQMRHDLFPLLRHVP